MGVATGGKRWHAVCACGVVAGVEWRARSLEGAAVVHYFFCSPASRAKKAPEKGIPSGRSAARTHGAKTACGD